MPNIREWRERIISVLASEKETVPGRAGETPLSNLADEFSTLGGRQDERIAVVNVVMNLVSDPSAELVAKDAGEYWRRLSFLVRYLPGLEKQELQSAFFAKLFDEEMRASGLSVFALHGYIAAGGRMTPIQLNRLDEIKEHAPIAWLGAAAMSSLFQFAREKTLEMLRAGRIDLNAFMLGMDSWKARWDREQDFQRLMIEFQDAVQTPAEKGKFDRWLERRGFQVHMAKHGTGTIDPKATAFISEIMTWAKEASKTPTAWQNGQERQRTGTNG